MPTVRSWTNVHEPVTELLGREGDLERIESAYDDGARLVTLRGTAGVGKSRCAVAYAASLSPLHYPGGVWLTELTNSTGEDSVLGAIAAALPDERRPATLSPASFGATWRDAGPTFVVLDDADESASIVARLVERWLRVAPALRCFVTSRARLGIDAEHVVPIEPLSPQAAIELLRSRARAARGAPLPTDPDTTELLARIVAALDHLPMAIELAAAQMVALEPGELLPRLDSALELLVSEDPTKTSRSRSLRGAIQLSWDLLDEPQRRALTECAVFHGELDLADAEAVTTSGPNATARLLASLCDRSLLRARHGGGRTTFEMYAAVRELARARLDARPDGAAIEQAWAAHVARAARSARHLSSSAEAVAILSHHHHELAALAEAALVDPSLDPDAESFLGLAMLARLRGPVSRAIAVLDDKLARADVSPQVEAQLLHARGLLYSRDGRPNEATKDLEQSVAIVRGLGDEARLAQVTTDLAHLMCHAGDRERAASSYEDALAVYERLGDDRGRGLVLAALAKLAHETGELDRARGLFAEAIPLLARASPTPLGLAGIRQNYGLLLQEAGDFDAAEAAYVEGLAAHARVGNRRFEGIAQFDLGGLALERGETGRARASFERALAIASEVGDRREIGLSMALLGVCEALLGARAAAASWLARADEELRRVGEPGLLRALEVHAAHLDLAVLRALRVDPGAHDETIAAEAERRARSAIDHAHAWAASCDEVRFAGRILRTAAGDLLGNKVAIVSADGTWFALPPDAARATGARVDLAARVALPRILAALLAHHIARPLEPLGAEGLIRAGWPETRSLNRASKNRLHVAINTLRKLGLGEHIVSHRDGYLLRDVVSHGFERGADH